MSAEAKMTGSQLVVVAVRGGTLSTRSCTAKPTPALNAETGQLRDVSAGMLSLIITEGCLPSEKLSLQHRLNYGAFRVLLAI